MSAVAILRAILVADSTVTAVVPVARIVSGVVPLGTVLPCLAITEVLTMEVPRIDGNAITTLVDGRVQVTVLARNYVEQKQLINIVRKACNYERGTLSGFQVVSIKRLLVGPDFSNSEAGIQMQSIDFSVVHYEPA